MKRRNNNIPIAAGKSSFVLMEPEETFRRMGLVSNALQHGMIYVGTGMLPAANDPESMSSVEGPGPEVHNRIGSFVGPMAASFQVDPRRRHLCLGRLHFRRCLQFPWYHRLGRQRQYFVSQGRPQRCLNRWLDGLLQRTFQLIYLYA